MGYRYPKDIFRSWDMPDDRIVRRMIQPAVEETTRLNEHNFVSGTFPNSRASEAMLYEFHTASVSSDMAITAGNGYLPVDTDPDAFRVSDSGEWVQVGDMEVSWTGAEDKVWAIGWAQYSIIPAGGVAIFSLGTASYTKPRLEFALRVNGVVVDATVTGCADPADQALPYFLPAEPITPAKNDYVSIDPRTVAGCGSLGWHCRAIRIQTVMPVPAGPVTVELVVRRVAPNDSIDLHGEMESVYVFNRKLIAIQMKQGGTGSMLPATSPSVEYPNPDTIWGSASLYSDMLEPEADALNALLEGNIMRWGLRRELLPSAVRQADQTALSAGTDGTQLYPGFGSSGTVGAGWDEVNDGAGANLRVTGSWDYSTHPAFVLILANVAFRQAIGFPYEANRYGAFAIAGQYTSGVDFHDEAAEAQVNNPNVLPGAVDQYDCDTDVPLLLWYDFRAAPPAGGAVSFYRVLAAFNGVAVGLVGWDRSGLQVIHFRP